jgi:hypothetical protein
MLPLILRPRLANRQYAVDFNNIGRINCGTDASLTDLQAAGFTVEAWIRPDTAGYDTIVSKGSWSTTGWHLANNSGDQFFKIFAATSSALSAWTPPAGYLENWHHIAGTYSDTGDRKARLYIDGVLKSTSNAAVGAIVSDAASALCISHAANQFDGAVAWVRISKIIRYTADFTPVAKTAPPPIDADTVEQWNLNEGTGTVATASVKPATNNGAITSGSWISL